MQKKKLYICIACIALLVGVAISQTFAYFTTESTTTNVITTGYVKMELNEEIKADGVNWEFIPISEATSILPGDTVEQKAYVTNIGSEDFYCRVSYEIQIEDAQGNTDTLDPNMITLNVDTDKWVLDEDGFYRYTDIVSVDETTSPLFDKVCFSTEMDNDYIGCTITIIVGSQSVQSEYNEYDETNGETVLDVLGFQEIESEVTE
ncbi:MAG: TasA family protein [Clostridia bacterium]